MLVFLSPSSKFLELVAEVEASRQFLILIEREEENGRAPIRRGRKERTLRCGKVSKTRKEIQRPEHEQ